MKVLLDECVPRELKSRLSTSEHECFTVPEVGLAGKKNGELLNLAQGKFDVFLTLDKGIRHQQNLTGRNLAVILIRAKSNRLIDILRHIPKCLDEMQSIRPGQLIVIGE